MGKKDEEEIWKEEAAKVKNSFLGKFFDGQKIADCVLRDDAADFRVRPNQLFLVTIPKITGQKFIPQEVEEKAARNAISELLFPYGLCSLSQNDLYFHPYHKTWELYHEDAAYHNGSIWTWNAGSAIEALCSIGEQDLAWRFAQNLASQLFEGPCAGSLSANLWAYPGQDGGLKFSGAYSSCRSTAEFFRAPWQAFLGMQVDLLENKISFCPRLPSQWKDGSGEILLGLENDLRLEISWSAEGQEHEREFSFKVGGTRLEKNKAPEIAIFFADKEECLNVQNGSGAARGSVYFSSQKGLDFAKPLCQEKNWEKPECLKQKNFLAEIALRQEFNPGHPASLTSIRS